MESSIVTILLPGFLTFFIGIGITPIITNLLYAKRAWKKSAGKFDLEGKETPIFNELHKEREVNIPRMGGTVIWISVAITTLFFFALPLVFPSNFSSDLNFLTRSQTWLPFAALLVGALVGLIDDLLEIRTPKEGSRGGGLPLRNRLLVVILAGLFAGWWFFEKLEVTAVAIPFAGELFIGWGIIPLFIFVAVGLYTSGVIDGIDGLSGGVFASVFAAYTFIAFTQQQYDLAAFSAAVVGGILAFLWFNVPPARFYMSETGSMALMLALAVVVFMTDTLGGGEGILLLPVIGFLLVLTAASSTLQIIWKRAFKRKLFPMAPLHHYFESIGWPGYKVTMRYWILGVIFAFLGAILALIA